LAGGRLSTSKWTLFCRVRHRRRTNTKGGSALTARLNTPATADFLQQWHRLEALQAEIAEAEQQQHELQNRSTKAVDKGDGVANVEKSMKAAEGKPEAPGGRSAAYR
jgi:hypothetical protein